MKRILFRRPFAIDVAHLTFHHMSPVEYMCVEAINMVGNGGKVKVTRDELAASIGISASQAATALQNAHKLGFIDWDKDGLWPTKSFYDTFVAYLEDPKTLVEELATAFEQARKEATKKGKGLPTDAARAKISGHLKKGVKLTPQIIKLVVYWTWYSEYRKDEAMIKYVRASTILNDKLPYRIENALEWNSEMQHKPS